MYFPYFRGKQYELITMRENATLLANSKFVPIIEPVKDALPGLERTLNELKKADCKPIVIVNPIIGDFAADPSAMKNLHRLLSKGDFVFSPGISLNPDMTDEDILGFCHKFSTHGRKLSLIHQGFTRGKEFSEKLAKEDNVSVLRHIFIENFCGKLYRKHFDKSQRILVRDGFEKMINRHYPEIQGFSDLHVTYKEENMDGFGDYLIVGADYMETGGPARAVAIHLTFIDRNGDAEMQIYHFVSDRTETTEDPAGKFAEALKKLYKNFNSGKSQLIETEAIKELLDLHERGHFPGLGYVKKLSMQHHLETLANFFHTK